MNVRKVTFTTDKSSYGVELQAEPQIPVLGKRLGKEAKNVFKVWVSPFLTQNVNNNRVSERN